MSTPFGFINAFKPPGPSSAAFGNWVKHVSQASAVGHWGTLDPSACGVLVLALGKATRLLPLLTDARKQYVFELVPGERTDTGDATGKVIAAAPVAPNWASGLENAAAALVGPLMQIPPMHSAVKVGGRPLYHAARTGRDVPRAPREVRIYLLQVIASEPSSARLVVECEAGTYVRALCEELGKRLGLPARMGALLRIASGPFTLRDSKRPDEIAADLSGCLIDPLTVLENPRIALDEPQARRFARGNEVHLSLGATLPPNIYGATNVDGTTNVEGATSIVPRSVPRNAPAVTAEVLVTTHAGALIGCGDLTQHDCSQLLVPTRVFTDAAQDT